MNRLKNASTEECKKINDMIFDKLNEDAMSCADIIIQKMIEEAAPNKLQQRDLRKILAASMLTFVAGMFLMERIILKDNDNEKESL